MISLKHVSYEWADGRKALKDINLEIRKGEFVLIAGKSGSGKSTLGSVMNGLIPHYYKGKMTGKVEVDGKDLRLMKLHEIGRVVGTVFQDSRSQFFTTTSDEEIAFGLQTIAQNKGQMKQRVEEVYRSMDIQELRERNVFELSSGEKQKIAIASIYAMKPNVLILDEPSANLDMKAAFELFKVLEKLKRSGTTVILIEHRLYYVKSLFDRFILIKDGAVVEDMCREDVLCLPEEFPLKNGLRLFDLNKLEIRKKKKRAAIARQFITGRKIGFYYFPKSAALNKGQSKNYVIRNLDFGINKAEAIGLIGLNGAGKTTFARLIAGLEEVREGQFSGEKGGAVKDKERIKQSYFVFQDSDYQLFSETLLDEMLIGLPKHEKMGSREKAIDILRALGLERCSDKHPFSLSRGEKQRLTIACGQMKNAEIFLYDEPTSGCDRDSMLAASALIRSQVQHGITVLIISHDIEFLAETVDSVWVMYDGKIEECIPMTNANKAQIIEKMMGGGQVERYQDDRSED